MMKCEWPDKIIDGGCEEKVEVTVDNLYGGWRHYCAKHGEMVRTNRAMAMAGKFVKGDK